MTDHAKLRVLIECSKHAASPVLRAAAEAGAGAIEEAERLREQERNRWHEVLLYQERNRELQGEVERLRAIVEAAKEMRQWGVVLDDERLRYIDVQVDRQSVEDFDEAVGEEKP